MSATRRIAFGAAAHWASRGVTILLGLVLMPVLLRNMPKEQVGLWLLLGQSWAVMGILDLGFGVTLTRRIALAKGKAGGDVTAALSPESAAEIADLVASGRRVHRWMALGVFLVALGSGFYYLAHLPLVETPVWVVWVAWAVLCACQALTVWQSTWICLLQGVGHVGWDALLGVAINGGTLLVQIAAVLSGGGIISLAVVATAGVVVQRLWLLKFIRQRSPELFGLQGRWNPALLKGVPGLALRAWVSSFGTVLVFNTDSFFIASMEGAADIPAYRAAFLVALNLHVLACVFAQSSSVFVSHFWQAGNLAEVHRILLRNLKLGWCILICGGAAAWFAGDSLFNLWLGAGNYPGAAVFGVLLVIFLMEQQSFIFVTSCRATDAEPFALELLAGGFLKLALAVPLVRWGGVLGLALATLLAQVSTAYIAVLRKGLPRLRFPLGEYLKTVVLPGLLLLGLTVLLCGLLARWLAGGPDLLRLAAMVLCGGTVLAAVLWQQVLEPGQRRQVLARIGGR